MHSMKLFRTVLARAASFPKRNYGGHGEHKVACYNDLPIPEENWQTAYDAQQRKYNMHLAFGVAFTIGSLVVAKASGLLYLNYSPPHKPAEDIAYK